MPLTPDRRPGEQREDDSILFEDRVVDIDSSVRGLYRKGQSLYGRDSIGVFNLRSGSGLVIDVATIEVAISSGKNKPYFEVTDPNWSVLTYLDFPGTTLWGTPTAIHAIAWQGSAAGTGLELRLINSATAQQLAYVGGITNTTPQQISFGSIANWPSSHAVIELQGLKDLAIGNVASLSIERT